MTRPQADLSRESLAFRVEALEQRLPAGGGQALGQHPEPEPTALPATPEAAEAPPLELQQLQEAWLRTVLPVVHTRSIPVETLLKQAYPSALDGGTLTLEFSASADFHRRQVEEPKNLGIVRDALYEVTGRKLAIATTLGDDPDAPEGDEEDQLSEEALISMFKDTFDAQEVEEHSQQ